MRHLKQHIVDASLGSFAAFLFLIPVFFTYQQLPYTAYSDVEITRFERDANGINVSANFVKNGECTFKELAVFSGTLGSWQKVEWYDISEASQGDRLAGRQTLHIRLAIPSWDKSTELEIRTRHVCGPDNEKTDMIFTRRDLS